MTNPELTAIEEIKALKARYFRYLDSKDYDGLDSIFTDDAVIDVRGSTTGTGGGEPAVDGLDNEVMTGAQFKHFFRTSIADLTTVHHGHMPEIQLEGLAAARGIWAFEDHIWFPAAHTHRKMHGWGHYHDRYVLTDGVWRLSEMKISRIRVETYDL